MQPMTHLSTGNSNGCLSQPNPAPLRSTKEKNVSAAGFVKHSNRHKTANKIMWCDKDDNSFFNRRTIWTKPSLIFPQRSIAWNLDADHCHQAVQTAFTWRLQRGFQLSYPMLKGTLWEPTMLTLMLVSQGWTFAERLAEGCELPESSSSRSPTFETWSGWPLARHWMQRSHLDKK